MSHYAKRPLSRFDKNGPGRHAHEKKCQNMTCNNTVFGYSTDARIGPKYCSVKCTMESRRRAWKIFKNSDNVEMKRAKYVNPGRRPDNQRFIMNRIPKAQP